MPMYEFKNGAKFESLNRDELHGALSANTASWFKEMSRGLKHMIMPPMIATPANSAVVFPPVGGEEVGPNPGFVWAIQRLSVSGLASGDVVGIYRNNGTSFNFVAQLTQANPFVYFGDKGFILRDSDNLYLANIGTLSATAALTVTGEFIECAEIDIWKIIGGN
jgi:hypothetical protein